MFNIILLTLKSHWAIENTRAPCNILKLSESKGASACWLFILINHDITWEPAAALLMRLLLGWAIQNVETALKKQKNTYWQTQACRELNIMKAVHWQDRVWTSQTQRSKNHGKPQYSLKNINPKWTLHRFWPANNITDTRQHTHPCNSIFVRTFVDIMHYPAPYPKRKHHN